MLAVSVAYADAPDLAARLKRLHQPVPQLDTSRTRKGSDFTVSYETPALKLRAPLDWVFKLQGPGNAPVTGATLRLKGGMPQHGHGFPTAPAVTEERPGQYRVKGLELQMPGWWALELEVTQKGKTSETVRFDLLVESSLDFAENEKAEMKRLWIGSLPALPAQDAKLVALGRKLFADKTLSRDGKTSCAVCHRADRAMTDGRVLDVPGQGPRKVPSILGAAWQSWFFWDGRKDSLWSQALAPFLNPAEYAMTEQELVKRARKKYGKALSFEDLGHAIAAFETTLAPAPSPFDRFVERQLSLPPVQPVAGRAEPFSDCAQRGFRTFIGKARCISCHNGPRFENGAFHNTGVPALQGEQGNGRYSGIKLAKADPYRCKGDCPKLDHAIDGPASLLSTFKTPSLRNVAVTPPYMHNGSMPTLEKVIEHYRSAPPGPNGTDVLPLELSSEESEGLVCFLKSLTSESANRP